MENSELISIIIPVYKVENYLKRCVDSIINQTYQELEILLIDDGSPDNCGNMCDEYAKKDKRIRVIHKINGGLSSARNIGIEMAKGIYIGFVDSDDWIEIDMYETLYREICRYNADISMCGSALVIDDKVMATAYSGKTRVLNSKEALLLLVEDGKIKSHAWDKLYRKSLFQSICFPEGKFYEDIFIMHNIFLTASKIVFVDQVKYYYVQRSGSIVSSQSIVPLLDMIEAWEKRYYDLREKNQLENYQLMIPIVKNIIVVLQFIISQPSAENKKRFAILISKFHKYKKSENIQKCLVKQYKVMYWLLSLSSALFIAYAIVDLFLKKHIKIKGYIKKAITMVDINWDRGAVSKFDASKYVTTARRIILFGGPEYNNLGDHAIAYATQKFIQNNISDYDYLEVSETEVNMHLDQIAKLVNEDDIIILQGGGNLGNVYNDQQLIRKKVIKSFPNNKIILFPQTIFFTDDSQGKKRLQQTDTLFSKHNKLFLLAREKYSYDIMRNSFIKNRVFLTPDIVISQKTCFQEERKGVFICLRDDNEGIYDIDTKNWILYKCREYFINVTKTDTCIGHNVSINDREEVLFNMWRKISSHKLVVTDRLHGIIFSLITNTPCITLGNYNYKVKGICDLLTGTSNIKFCQSIDDFDDLLKNMQYYECLTKKEDTNIKAKFQIICDIIEGRI